MTLDWRALVTTVAPALATALGKLEEIAAADRADARRMTAKTGDLWTPRALALVVIVGFFGAVLAVFAGVADLAESSTATLVGAVVGYASAKADQVVAYWFGSSAGSKAKTEELASLARGQR